MQIYKYFKYIELIYLQLSKIPLLTHNDQVSIEGVDHIFSGSEKAYNFFLRT